MGDETEKTEGDGEEPTNGRPLASDFLMLYHCEVFIYTYPYIYIYKWKYENAPVINREK